jgi:outer membrane protein assembly factor BamB
VQAAVQAIEGQDQWLMDRGDLASTGAVPTALPSTLEELWRRDLKEPVEATALIVGEQIIVATVDGRVLCLAISDGTTVWEQSFETNFIAPPSVADGLIVIGDLDGVVRGLELSSGKLVWTQATDGEINAGAAIVKDLVLVTSQDGSLYGLDRKTGERRWVYTTGDQIRCRPTVVEGRTFLGGCDGSLHTVLIEDGSKGAEPMALDGPTGSTPAIYEHLAVLPTHGGSVMAFDWREGKQLWSYADPDHPQEYRTSAAVTEKFVVVTSQNKKVVALDPKTGATQWTASLRRRADSSPIIAGNDVWIAATDGRLYRFDLQTGNEKWVFEIKGGFLASPAIANDRLVAVTEAGIMICFGGGTGNQPNSAGK